MAMYRFKSLDDNNAFTPERKALELAFGGSAYDNSIYIMALDRGSEKSKRNFYKSIPIFDLSEFVEKLKFTDNKDYYICPNPMKKGIQKRTEDTLFSVKNIVIDIDAHDYNGDFNELKPIIIKTMKDEFEENGLPLWNIQVFTGRGFQLWWCLEETAKPLLWLYKDVQKGIMNAIQDIINSYGITFDESLTLDKASSGRAAGLFRLFGTYNYTTKTKTEVEVLSEKSFSLNTLKEFFCKTEEKLKEKKHTKEFIQKVSRGKFTYNKSINEYRVEMIEKLVSMRGDCTGTREMIAFVYYNECVQVYDRNIAKGKLDELNASFSYPLHTREIRALVRGIDKAVNQKNHINCYILKNARIIEMLNMNDLEQSILQFFPGMAGTPDKNRSRNTRRKNSKEARNKKIISLAEKGVARIDIAKQVGCSYPTVYRLLKKLAHTEESKVINACIDKATEAVETAKEMYNNLRNATIKAFKEFINREQVNEVRNGINTRSKPIKLEDKILYYMTLGQGKNHKMLFGKTHLITAHLLYSPRGPSTKFSYG